MIAGPPGPRTLAAMRIAADRRDAARAEAILATQARRPTPSSPLRRRLAAWLVTLAMRLDPRTLDDDLDTIRIPKGDA